MHENRGGRWVRLQLTRAVPLVAAIGAVQVPIAALGRQQAGLPILTAVALGARQRAVRCCKQKGWQGSVQGRSLQEWGWVLV